MFGNKRIKELEAENAKLRKLLGQKVFDATTIVQLGTRPGSLVGELEGGFAQLLAECFADQFFNSTATNYLELNFTSKDLQTEDRLSVTIQRVSGKTPGQLKTEAEAKLAEAQEQIEALRAAKSNRPDRTLPHGNQ